MLKTKNMETWRFEALSFLVITGLILAAWIALQFAGSNLQTIERSGLDTTVLAQQETFVVDELLTIDDLLASTLKDIQKEHPGRYSIKVTDLESRQTTGLNSDQTQKSASLYKLFIANEALRMVDDGKMTLSQHVDSGRGLNLEECLEIMIQVSDNGCGVLLQSKTGAVRKALPQLKTQGFENTDLRGIYPLTTADDVNTFFLNLVDRSYLSDRSTSLMLQQLASQQINDRIPALLPSTATVSHKTAKLEGYIHDAGIVYGETTNYVLVIMSQPQSGSYEDRFDDIAEISKKIYDVLN